MTPKEHAVIWRKAAAVVAGMNTMQSELQAHTQMQQHLGSNMQGLSGRSYSADEMVMNRAYNAAAQVLMTIAREYEAVGEKTGS